MWPFSAHLQVFADKLWTKILCPHDNLYYIRLSNFFNYLEEISHPILGAPQNHQRQTDPLSKQPLHPSFQT